MGQDGSKVQDSAGESHISEDKTASEIDDPNDIITELGSETNEERSKLLVGSANRVTSDLKFHAYRAEYLSNRFKEELILDPMQLDIIRKMQQKSAKTKSRTSLMTRPMLKKKYGHTSQLLKTHNFIIDEAAGLNLRSGDIFANLSVTLKQLNEQRELLDEEKKKLQALKDEYRKLKSQTV